MKVFLSAIDECSRRAGAASGHAAPRRALFACESRVGVVSSWPCDRIDPM